MNRLLLIVALALALSVPAFADCGNEPPAGSDPLSVMRPIARWVRKVFVDGWTIPGITLMFKFEPAVPGGIVPEVHSR